MDYASWVRNLSYEEIKAIYEDSDQNDDSFEAGFDKKFRPDYDGTPKGPGEVNEEHTLTVVASELDSSTERIIGYLHDEFEVPINAVRFNYYSDDGREYIARTWLKDPFEVEDESEDETEEGDSWNGHDYYANYGESQWRRWSDAREYGFVAAGQGTWYSRTMGKASEGDRLFVYSPGEGYIGVGIVNQEKTAAPDFEVEDGTPITEADLDGDLSKNEDDPELREYLIGVDWVRTRDIENAIWEKGMYANQNTVTELSDKQTLDKLYEEFGVSAPDT